MELNDTYGEDITVSLELTPSGECLRGWKVCQHSQCVCQCMCAHTGNLMTNPRADREAFIVSENNHKQLHFRGVARRKIRWFLKAMIMGKWCTKIVISRTHCTITAFTYCSMWYQHCGHMHAREHHIYICNGSLNTSVSDKLETTKKSTKHV